MPPSLATTGEAVRPGSKDFDEALRNVPDSVRAKLKTELGAEFSQLRPLPPGKLRRPR